MYIKIKKFEASEKKPEGVLVYMRTPEDNDALAWINQSGESVTESQLVVLKMAECSANTEAAQRLDRHHEFVEKAIRIIAEEEKSTGGQLGRPSGARFRTYERLKRYVETA